MNILIAASTTLEIQPALDFLQAQNFRIQKKEFTLLVTGIGGMATTYNLTKSFLQKRFDYSIQAGIAGSFHSGIPIGSVVAVQEELMGDLGAEENNEFKDVFDLGLMSDNDLPFSHKILKNSYIEDHIYGIPLVRSIGVNEITTRKERIELLRKKFSPDIESMEGGAFHYVCLREKIPFLQLRAISNYVGERNKAYWKLQEAIKNLNEFLIKIMQEI